ncbi:MAG: hypothetical protein ACE5HA_16885 [Anaerolineae bacterium]
MSITTDVTDHKRLDRGRIGPLLLVGLGLMLLLAGVGWLAVDRLVIGQGKITLPDSLAGWPLSTQVSGRPALVEIERLHGKSFLMVDGAVARYGDGMATVWVSSTWTPFLAERQVAVMTERIAEGRSPFTPVGADEREGVTVYALTGMGQRHYYFQRETRVVWLAVSPQFAEESLEELIYDLR